MPGTGTITVIPLSGLANRLRVIATSIKLARISNKELVVYWEANKYLNAEFQELFETPANVIIGNPPFKYSLWLKAKSLSAKLTNLSMWYLDLFQFDFVFLDSMAEMVWHNKIDLQKEVDKVKTVFICSCQELNYFNLDDYKLFIPRADLLKSIGQVSKQFAKNTIGIHIRGTDNIWSKENSPFPIFMKKIEEEINCNRDVTFFLSTDDEKYQEILLQQYGSDRILFYKKEFRRNVTAGIKDAVIDLFCLSKTSKIYGSYFSSFSYVAGRIGNIPVEILKKKS